MSTLARVGAISRHVLPDGRDAAVLGAFAVNGGATVKAFKRVLIANRGEIACRIHRAAKALGLETVGVYTTEDANGLHRTVVDKAVQLPVGPNPVAPYLDVDVLVDIAISEGCGAVHPGYGFLSEREDFAALCEEKGIKFVGPRPHTIGLFGDKVSAKEQAAQSGLPVLTSSPNLTTADAAFAFLVANPMKFPLLLKASFGGGGRGQAVVEKESDFKEAFTRCSQEAELSFGRPEVFIERFLQKASHIEVQILGDGTDCVHLFERDCSVQVRKQKVVEIAPAPGMHPELRERMCSAAVRLCKACGYRSAGTVEFLVEGSLADPDSGFYFLELNPRIQVEHTITEEVTGIDLVQMQFRIAAGETLEALSLCQAQLSHRGFSIQVRVGVVPGGGGVVREYSEPSGVRVESSAALGTEVVEHYDPMVAKLVVTGASYEQALANAHRALAGFIIGGAKINRDFLRGLLEHKDLQAGGVHTTWVEDLKLHISAKKSAGRGSGGLGSLFAVDAPFPGQVTEVKVTVGDEVDAGQTILIISAMKMLNDVSTDRPGKVIEVLVELNAQVAEGTPLVKIEATGDAPVEEDDRHALPQTMRGLSGIVSPGSDVAHSWYVDGATDATPVTTPILKSKAKPNHPVFLKRSEHNKAICAELQRRLNVVRRGGPEKSVRLHRSRGKNLVRERILKIIDKGTSILELSALAAWEMYGGGVHSGGVVSAIGVVQGREVMFIGTDATIKGGVTFPVGYQKWLRAQAIAEANRIPCVYLIDGGGAKLDAQASKINKDGNGRDMSYEGQLPAAFTWGGRQFYNQARMSAKGIPQVAVVCGMCTAGGAYTPAMCDETIIVKENGTVYLGGPPLVKAATGEDADEQSLGGAVMHTTKSGTCDNMAPDEDTALAMCREVIEHLSRRIPKAQLANRIAAEPPLYDKESILGIVPESVNIPYDIREVIARLVDGSRFHEFKAKYGPTIVCGWAHLEGYPVGIVANNGMIFSESALKATHFIQICGHRGTPLIFLHNVTGFIIGTSYEQGGITKDGAKMVNAVSNVPVPKFSIVCGGSFGAGNYAMCGPAFEPRFTFLWPGARISVMGGEQAAGVIAIVKQNQLKRMGQQQIPDEMVAMLKQPIIDAIENSSSAYHSSAGLFDDGIIDPRDTREVLAKAISIALNAPLPESGYGVFRM